MPDRVTDDAPTVRTWRFRRGRSRTTVLLFVGTVLLVATAVLALPRSIGPPSAASAGPGGTLALRRFLAGMGLRISDGANPPELPGTFVLLSDLRDDRQASALLDWVSSGGRLVIADPRSVTAGLAGIAPAGAVASFTSSTALQPTCVSPQANGVHTLVVRSADDLLSASDDRGYGCFSQDDRSFEHVALRGNGMVVVLGGTSPLTNEFLGQADNAVFALDLVGTSGPVVFGPALPPGAGAGPSRGIWNLLPPGAQVAIVGFCLAAACFALVQGRRLGRPVAEEPLSPIPGSELIRASGSLYRAGRATGFAARLLREAASAQLAGRLGLPAATSPADLASPVARAAGMSEDEVRDAMSGSEPADDARLIDLARRLEELRRRTEGALR